MEKNYDDIIHLSRPLSAKHPPMPVQNRAAQFAPFAALTGYDAAVNETARVTDDRAELDDYAKAVLSEKLQLLAEHADAPPEVKITYFEPDKKKSGGAYVCVTGSVKSIDEYERIVVMEDGVRIPIGRIYEIDSKLFTELGYA